MGSQRELSARDSDWRTGPGETVEYKSNPSVYSLNLRGHDRGRLFWGLTRARTGDKKLLAVRLWAELAAWAPAWTVRPDQVISLDQGPLGRPLLSAGRKPGPAVSFSRGGDLLWAAVSATENIGCDWCGPEDFQGDYPLARVFNPVEWDKALGLGGSPIETAALLWSLKEAAVKAWGEGFHFIDPLEVSSEHVSGFRNGHLFEVRAGRAATAWAGRIKGGWLALAVSR